MKRQNRNIIKYGLLIAIILLLELTIFITGCGKKEQHEKSGESPAAAEKKDEHGIVTLSPEIQKDSGIEVKQVVMSAASVPLSTTAAIELNTDRTAKISPRVTGKAMKIIASQGDRVKAGQVLAYIDSVELDQIWSDYRKAQGKIELAKRNLQREETLFEKKISPEKDVLKARQELGEAEAEIYLARERFRMIGVDSGQFESARKNGSRPMIPLISPVGGTIIEKTVTQGEIVSPEKIIFTIAELSTLWIAIDIYEKDMSRLKAGTGVKVSVTAFPDKVFKGKISYIADVVDEKTRTEKARVTIDNAGGLLKPGMFATIVTEETNGGTERLITVPEEAVQIEGNARYVFVRISPNKFKKRDIEIGRTIGKNLEVTAGLKEGEMIAVKGGFTLKSELKKSEIEGDAH